MLLCLENKIVMFDVLEFKLKEIKEIGNGLISRKIRFSSNGLYFA